MFRIKFKIPILDLMSLQKKTVFHLKWYTTVVSILARPDDTSSRSLAFRALNYG